MSIKTTGTTLSYSSRTDPVISADSSTNKVAISADSVNIAGTDVMTKIGTKADKDFAQEFRSHPWLGCVMKIDDKTYRIYCEPTWNNSGVDVSEDTYPEFYKAVPQYLKEHPEKLITGYSDSNAEKKNLERQIHDLKDYLDSTDYIVVKCAESGVSVEDEYPQEYEVRQLARSQIATLRQELENKTS